MKKVFTPTSPSCSRFHSYQDAQKQELLSPSLELHLGTINKINAQLCLSVWKSIQGYLSKEKSHFLLAVSGGVDSIAMLAIFKILQKKYVFNLTVASFNHSIRQESIKEIQEVESLCARFNIPFISGIADVPNLAQAQGLGLEEVARQARYTFLENCRQSVQADYICTAHHAQDLCEDVLMRLMRGATWPALGGMPAFDAHRFLLRPLLEQKKETLIRLVKDLGLTWSEDASNANEDFLRNHVRRSIAPLFYTKNPRFFESIQKLHKNAEQDKDFFAHLINRFWQHVSIEENSFALPVKALQQEHEAMRFRIYVHALQQLEKGYPQNNTLQKMDKAVLQNKGNSTFQFSDRVRAHIQNSQLVFFIKEK